MTERRDRCRQCGATYVRTEHDGGICDDCALEGVTPA